MGIFNKTEEEIRKEEENRKYNYLIDRIWKSTISDKQRQILLNYISQVRKGQPNDFGDVDTLSAVIIRIIESGFDQEKDFLDHLNQVIDAYHMVVNSSTENASRIRERFIEDFVCRDGILDRNAFREEMFGIFQNKEDYFQIMDVIGRKEVYIENMDLIVDYIMKVCKYCMTQEILKNDILSFLSKFDDVLDGNYEKLCKTELEEAKKRINIYNLDPKELAKVDSKFRRIEAYFDQLDIHMKQIKDEREALATEVESGKKEIKKETSLSVEQLKALIATLRKELEEKLNQYLIDLKEDLKNKSDETFRQIMETYQQQVEEFRELFQGYSLAASKDYMSLQKKMDESIQQIQDYVANEPQFRTLLTKVQEQNAVRTKLVELINKEKELDGIAPKKSEAKVSIPGYEKRVMVPYRHMILPPEISSTINPFLDEKIPFSRRKEEIFKKIEQREKDGEIFHKKIPQIVIDIMEGDWPYLWGPSGTGKSYMIKQAASLLGMSLTKAGKITEPYSILGYNDPQGRYQITPSFIATLYGHLLLLDEMDNGNPDTQVVLNDIYSELLNKLESPEDVFEVTFGTDIQVDVHPNFRMISAGNTSGAGENETFSSRGKMDESIQERLTPIYIDYDDRVEEKILHNYPEWYQFFIQFRKACMSYAKDNEIDSAQGITTTRDAAAIKKYIIHDSKSVDQIIDEKFIQIKDSEYRKALGRFIAKQYGINYDSCKDFIFNGPLEKADGKVLAKKFIVASKREAA